jgi:hypothetical protein
LAVALAGCGGESETVDNMLNDPGVKKPVDTPDGPGVDNPDDPGNNTGDCTVYYQPGNGAGTSWSKGANKNTSINLPDATKLTAPQGATEFVGWNDGMLTYPAAYKYTVTEDITFNARWAFTTLEDIKTYLAGAHGDPVLISVADGSDPSLTWQSLMLAIQTAGEANKYVELDLTGSTLALFGDANDEFDYTNSQWSAYNGTGEQYIKKLVLPSAATSIKTNAMPYFRNHFSSLEAASGLNISAIPENAFAWLSKLEEIVFPAAKTIGRFAFANCSALTKVSLPAATNIGDSAFTGCTNLISVSLPAAETIDNGGFNNCGSLTSVSLPAAKTIGFSAFNNCTSLISVSLPAAKTIGSQDGAFYNCPALTTITIGEGCDINDNYIHSGSFKTYYNTMLQAAGVYTYSGSSWSYAELPAPEEET